MAHSLCAGNFTAAAKFHHSRDLTELQIRPKVGATDCLRLLFDASCQIFVINNCRLKGVQEVDLNSLDFG